jgi:thiosulfate dehydrogenase [quinone] large subunit
MRLFLGITFIYAGVQKLTDPQFFHRSTPGYIGNQIIAFAHGSPLQYFLTRIALPHAVLFGMAVALGEIAIGLGAFLGVLFRPAAFFGVCLSALFFLSASWHVYPYFYGSDIVFVFCWLTLLFNGPRNTGLPSVDFWLVDHVLPTDPTRQLGSLVALGRALLVGWPGPIQRSSVAVPTGPSSPSAWISERSGNKQRTSVVQKAREARRHFIRGMLTGGAGVLGVVVVGYLIRMMNDSSATVSSSTSDGDSTSSASSEDSQATSTPMNTTMTTGAVIARVSAVPENNATTFTIPSTGDPGVLIHLPSDQFVAYDAICTHAGCTVDYDPASHLLICPCHGAEYDPAHGATVLQGPTDIALTSVSIHIDSITGSILMVS